MATSLSELQIVSLFEALDIPYALSFYAQDGMGSISQVSITPYILNARDVVLAYINNPPSSDPKTNGIAGTALETRLKTRLDQWDEISSYTGEMKEGGAGNSSGLNFSFKGQREHLRELICLICPFPAYHMVLYKRAVATANGSMMATITRG